MQASIDHCLGSGLPFAAYRMPGEAEPRLILQEEGEALSFELGDAFPLAEGYLILPFSPGPDAPAFMIRPDRTLREDDPGALPEKRRGIDPFGDADELPLMDDQGAYMHKVEALLKAIRADPELEKVVLSRVERMEEVRGRSLGEQFDRLCASYPNAFVHLFQLPGRGVWGGATPEILFELRGGEGKLQALAGTRPKGEDKAWTKKEEREQELVAEHIASVLRGSGIGEWRTEGPMTVGAGSVEHLSTLFRFRARSLQNEPGPFLRALHPTPAVCGTPRDRALEQLRKIEGYDRSFYAGAIGPWNIEGEHALYVNLRCFRALKDAYLLYLGGGINEGSDPQQEWEETVWKAKTLRAVLDLE